MTWQHFLGMFTHEEETNKYLRIYSWIDFLPYFFQVIKQGTFLWNYNIARLSSFLGDSRLITSSPISCTKSCRATLWFLSIVMSHFSTNFFILITEEKPQLFSIAMIYHFFFPFKKECSVQKNILCHFTQSIIIYCEYFLNSTLRSFSVLTFPFMYISTF